MGAGPKYSLPGGVQGNAKPRKREKASQQGQKSAPPKTALPRNQSVGEIAEIFTTHEKTVRKWIAAGCPASKRKRAYFLNDGEVQHWLAENNRKTTPGRPAQEKPPIPPELGGDKDYWLARKYRRECLEKEGQLIELQAVKQWIGTHIGTAKNKLAGLGAALASMLEGRDEAERQQIIETRVDEVLNELSSTAACFGGSVEAP